VAAAGGEIEAFVGDISRREEVRQAVDRCVARFGRLDGLVVTAGITMIGPFLETTDEGWQRTMDANMTGTFCPVQEAPGS
jgi:NAD(P)-dependent dehydrogenase (short-subunit alcohol dehydrogenase family)